PLTTRCTASLGCSNHSCSPNRSSVSSSSIQTLPCFTDWWSSSPEFGRGRTGSCPKPSANRWARLARDWCPCPSTSVSLGTMHSCTLGEQREPAPRAAPPPCDESTSTVLGQRLQGDGGMTRHAAYPDSLPA